MLREPHGEKALIPAARYDLFSEVVMLGRRGPASPFVNQAVAVFDISGFCKLGNWRARYFRKDVKRANLAKC